MNADVSAATTVVEIDGVFDVSAAKQLARELDEMGYAEVRIDLTRVREFHDFGVALLARELSGRVRTTVSGLRQHHIRLLRYLGIDAALPAEGEQAELA
jgi:anti-anti-sigma regulatory factor